MRPSIVEEQRRRRRDFEVVWEMMLGLEKARLPRGNPTLVKSRITTLASRHLQQLSLLYYMRSAFVHRGHIFFSGIFTEMADSVLYIYQTFDVLTPALPMRGYSERYKPLSASHSVPRRIKWVRKLVQTCSNLCLLAFHCFLWRYSGRQVLLFWMHIRFP